MDSTSTPDTNRSDRLRNALIALAAIALTIALFFGIRTQNISTSLETVAQAATPIDSALANNKPTILEFYADWCTSCQSMAADNLALQKQYGDRVNFAMLNVDNNKWLPEITKYRVDGIPRFIFLSSDNKAIGDAVGVIPHSIMAANIEAMMSDRPLPHNSLSSDRISTFKSPQPADTTNPRDHG
ncbi:thioredoxin domain-containing protein [Tumidithrix helvetica PCC 7403]|uniref:Thioredoxin domain-containing protein n=1 Tax=Tumidithrix elongata BACA0141 TaxID=2716417 RepID=A0AAW9Q3W9_9CYAN|nr:thioredoxin domain-containing protein [Tumidithrix elongata RA019]